MSWMMELVKTYDTHADLVGKADVEGSKGVLTPICHVTKEAQIEITINGKGEFIHARVLSQAEQSTLMPCTPASEVRTSNHTPHPLHDQLNYIARDYELYDEKQVKKNKKNDTEEKSPYALYVELLGKWVYSPYSNPKVEAVYTYVTQHDVINDLCREKILYLDDNGKIMNKWPYGGKKPAIFTASKDDVSKYLVRFRVSDLSNNDEPDLWKDQQLQRQYIAFFEYEFSQELDLCYATGKMMRRAGKQGKGIRSSEDKAKLISSNDEYGFTFRGRFETGAECLSLGHETLQKATNALIWLIRNQGYNYDNRVFWAWSSKTIPDIFAATEDCIVDKWSSPLEITRPQTAIKWVKSFDKAIKGYYHDFERDPDAQVNVLVLDAATLGRLAICYYDEFSGTDFVQRIEKWHKSGRWIQHKDDPDKAENEEKKNYRYHKTAPGYLGVPAPSNIIKACYGDKKKMKTALDRIFHCIVQGRPLPIDMERCIVRRVVTKATQAVGDKYYYWRQQIVEPACTVICNRWNQTHPKEVYEVALDETNRNRDYLFGRILAVADQIERSTFKGKDKYSRLTNAMKYMEVFSMRPAKTWMTIHNRLLPYMQKQKEKHGSKELELLARITDLFQEDDFVSDAPLGSRFLLGFYSQQVVIQQESQDYTDSKNSQSGESDSDDQSDEA